MLTTALYWYDRCSRVHFRFAAWTMPIVAFCAIGLLSVSTARAGLIYASATPSPTGGPASGPFVSPTQMWGVRFEVASTMTTATIGGHFARFNGFSAPVGTTIFGALVALSSSTDLPDSNDLSTPDVLGSAELTIPSAHNDSDIIDAPLSVTLTPGWYAVVFGTQSLIHGGTAANGIAMDTNTDIGNPSYIALSPGTGGVWGDTSKDGFYFFVTAVPEPSSWLMAALAAGGLLFYGRRRRAAT